MVISYFSYAWDINGISAGAAIKAKEFINAIEKHGHTVHLEWRMQQPGNEPDISTKIKERIKPYLQKYLRESRVLLSNLGHLKNEHKILKQQKPDIFFPRLEYGNISCFLLSKWLNIPTVVEVDCPPTHEWETFYAQDALKFGDLSLKLEIVTLKQADAVIVQSNQLMSYYESLGVSKEKIYVIPNAADIKKFQPREKYESVVSEYKLQDKIVIGWIGAGYAWTGIDVVIDMAKKLMRNYPSVRFLMVGSKHNMDVFQTHFNSKDFEDRVILPGFVPHEKMPDYLSCMDIVLAPYPKLDFFYASSMKLFEYMAAGKAIVATRIGQMAEVIQDGINGFLFEPDLSSELYEKVELLVTSEALRKKISQNARYDAERKWNWDQVGNKMIQVFEEVLTKRNAHRC